MTGKAVVEWRDARLAAFEIPGGEEHQPARLIAWRRLGDAEDHLMRLALEQRCSSTT